MKHILKGGVFASAILALAASVSAGQARDLTIVSFGGNYQDAQREIYFKPFSEKTGTPFLEESWDGGIGVLAAKMENPPADWDVVQVEVEELELGCADGLYEKIDWEALGGKDKFIDAAVHDCGVGTIVWSTAIAYDGDKLKGDNVPKSWADFWDTKKFPGKRGLRRIPKYTLEFALMADGVPAEEVYKVLGTPEGVDRAFKKLDEIKNDIVWWEAGAQPLQLLASGEVAMTAVYNGRITGINKSEGKNFKIVWPGSIYAVDSWVIMKDSPNKEKAMEFIKFASQPENQAKLPNYVAYGLTNVEASKLVPPDLLKELPTAPENLEGTFAINGEFWIDNVEELNKRFNAWLAQ
jgi:putative spermidine/putrescine transport system substrate-binding protein